MKKKIYLANPYGFSALGSYPLSCLKTELIKLGLEVWEPFERNEQVEFSQVGAAYRIAQADKQDVEKVDAVFAVVNGNPPDEGVCVELGIAIALEKPTFLFRDDFRRCSDSEEYPLNLMLFAGIPYGNWQDYYYTDIAQIKNEKKALYKWVVS